MLQTCSQPNMHAEGFQHWDNGLNILGLRTPFTLKMCHRFWHTFYVCGFVVLIFTIQKLKVRKDTPPSAIKAVGEVLVGCPTCVWTQLRPHGLLGRMRGCPGVLDCSLIAVGYGRNQFPGFHWLISCITGREERTQKLLPRPSAKVSQEVENLKSHKPTSFSVTEEIFRSSWLVTADPCCRRAVFQEPVVLTAEPADTFPHIERGNLGCR